MIPNSTRYILVTFLIILAVALVIGCSRGRTSKEPPIHLNPNMDDQERYNPQSESQFFADSATMRVPVVGTVERGDLREDDAYYRGLKSDGSFIAKNPLAITTQLLKRGQERFNIYCSPCHSRLGDGRGIMVNRGYVPPPSFHDDRIRQMPDGEIFNTITNGIRNMPSYRHQIPVNDRWAIIAYLRALERSQNATIDDIPEELRDRVK